MTLPAEIDTSARARFYRAVILLLPLYASLATLFLPWDSVFRNDAESVTAHFWDSLRIVAGILAIWFGLLVSPGSIRETLVLLAGLLGFILGTVGLALLVSRSGFYGVPVICAAVLALPLLVAARGRPGWHGWIEQLGEVLRVGLLRGLAGLGAGLITLGVLWAASALLSSLLRDFRFVGFETVAGVVIGICATLALMLAWEEWTEPLVRRFWSLFLPVLLAISLLLSVAVLWLGSDRFNGLFGTVVLFTLLAAGLLFAAGTKRDPGLLSTMARLAALPLALLAAFLLVRMSRLEGWKPAYLHVSLILVGVTLAAVRAWVARFLPRLWLPEGIVTAALPIIALVGILEVPRWGSFPARPETPVTGTVALVWPPGAQLPEEARTAIGRTCYLASGCTVLMQDLDGDGSAEIINLTARTIWGNAKGAKRWMVTGTLVGTVGDTRDVTSVETVPSEWQDLMINGYRVRTNVFPR
ncbi:hypothetical protein ACFSM5_20880 [Lacibacterium aquatile]|uniref:DUF4153 domain-containing protein n=1 Tax=Lacibacterium aquatile TaxID=1168082 RepID=A0ABW5E150_9PROT